MKRRSLAPALALATLVPLAALPTIAAAHETGPGVASDGTLLSVSTRGSTSQKPDVALFTAGVATTGKTAKAALSANSAAMNQVIRSLKSSGIAERDIQTSNLSISPVYASRSRSGNELEDRVPPIIGYRANNQVIVKQRKLGAFGKVIDTLVSAGANQVSGPNFQVEDTDSALDEARREAMAAARKRAQLYAKAAGLRVRRILSISESGGYSPRPQPMMARVAMDEGASTPVSAGEVELQVNVSVQFELAP